VPTARLFWNGRSQAVRLPKQFRFDGDEVHIEREGRRIVLTSVRRSWPRGYWRSWRTVPDDFVAPPALTSRSPSVNLER
jgi:antitoxin VapB